MKRTFLLALLVCLMGVVFSSSSGCATSNLRAVTTTRQHEAHAFRNRIHNPADYRYTSR